MKKFLIILVMVSWCNVGVAEIIHLKCKGVKGVGDYAGNSYNTLFEYKIDTQKKTFEILLPSRSDDWKDLKVLEWKDKSIKSVSGDFIEDFNWVTYRATFVDVPEFKNGYMQFDCKRVSGSTKVEIASMIDKAKDTCKSLGFKEGTEKFSDCALKLYSQSVELAAKQNQQIVMQPQSSGSNVMTIYDPVRDSNALMDKGMKMLTGRCTLGLNC